MRDEELKLLSEIANTIATKRPVVKHELAASLAMKGKRSHDGLFVVGQAPNGWFDLGGDINNKWSVEHLDDHHDNSIISRVERLYITDDNAIRWISRHGSIYDTNKSSFWRVTRALLQGTCDVDTMDEGWPDFIIWSNLYKVSPANGGNPSPRLMGLQHVLCEKILHQEFEQWQPKKILFITGTWYKAFELALELESLIGMQNKTVLFAGTTRLSSQSKVVVVARPERKNEKKFVEDTLAGFNALG